MPTITIRNGNRTLKLTKRERDTLMSSVLICRDIETNFPQLLQEAKAAVVGVADLVLMIDKAENGKPAAPKTETAK